MLSNILLTTPLLAFTTQKTFLSELQASSLGNPFDESSHEYFVNPWFANEIMASKSLTDS